MHGTETKKFNDLQLLKKKKVGGHKCKFTKNV